MDDGRTESRARVSAGFRIRAVAAAAAALLAAHGATGTDTAFWKPYKSDDNTYALLPFEGAEPLSGVGLLAGIGRLAGGARIEAQGRFGAALHVDGSGHAVFPTTAFDPGAKEIHVANSVFSIEAWVRLHRYPATGETACIVFRADNQGRCAGFSLFVTADGALGMSFRPVGGKRVELVSANAKVPLDEWCHVAGVCAGGHMSVGCDTLYVNGIEILNRLAAEGIGRRRDESPADLCVGGAPDARGVAGLIDEVRVHSRVGRFWPLDPMPWIDRLSREGLPPLDDVLEPERQPWLCFHLDGDARPTASPALMARDPAMIERFNVSFQGSFVPGVKGQAAGGNLKIGGFRLGDWREGSIEFWFRPRGVNNVSDRNVGLVGASGLNAYFFNSVGQRKPFSFYYHDDERELHMHGSGADVHPGRWYHMVFAWGPDSIVMYMDGVRASEGVNNIATKANKGTLNEVVFSPAFDVDEVCFYERRLSADEVSNRYWSYVDPVRVKPVEPPAPIELSAWRLPSENALYYRLVLLSGKETVEKVAARLSAGDGRDILTFEGRPDGEIHRVDLPPLADGAYVLRAAVTVGGRTLESAQVVFLAAGFPWVGNQLGVTNEVYPPFEPIRVEGSHASVVLRTYRMNGFGLWDSVQSQGRELLGDSVRLRYVTVDGVEGDWTFGAGAFVSAEPHRAVYQAAASSPAVAVESVSEIEMDGMMKVTLRLRPGPEPVKIARLWLDIPVKASEATLMHEDTGSMRNNYSGLIPEGEGTVWKSHGRWSLGWRNAFCGYLWIGGEARGIAWFAENDKGWITEKGQSEKPLQELVRSGDNVTLRVHLVNVPSVIEGERELVFGLQASPAKPMPEDWRTGARGGGLPVVPWGGHQCADKFPYRDDWRIVDKIVEQQVTGTNNTEWFREYRERHDVPPMRGTEDWLSMVTLFASRKDRPTLAYFEEMAAPTCRNDWQVYLDEWSPALRQPRRNAPKGYDGPRENWPDGYDIFRQRRPVEAAARVTFTASYREYGAWYANEWLKRGIGIYWDNTYLTTSANPLTTAAYRTEDGRIQPGLTLWNQREYSKRVWNLMHRWRRERGEKLLFLQHMTNAGLLPILSWCTTSFDNEYSPAVFARNVGYPRRHDPKEPFPPDYLRAQSMGRQTGTYPALCHGLFRLEELGIARSAIPPHEMDTPTHPEASIFAQKREWGMSCVHEIPAFGGYGATMRKLGAALSGFGYARRGVTVHNYWVEPPALKTDRNDVKWLLLARPDDKRLFVVLQSWSRDAGPANLDFDHGVIGFRPEGAIVDLETGRRLADAHAGALTLDLATPYACRIIGVGAPPLPDGARFQDTFDDGPSLIWTGLNSIQARNGLLRLGRNETPWQGPVRVEKWAGLDDTWRDTRLDIEFRLPKPPDAQAPAFTVVTRATPPGGWSEHGLSHTRLHSGQFLHLRAGARGKPWEAERWTCDSGGRNRSATIHAAFGATDAEPHTLSLVMEGPRTRLLFDDAQVAVFEGTPESGAAFGIHGENNLSNEFHVDIDCVTVR